MAINFTFALQTYQQYRDQLGIMVRGGEYTSPKGEMVTYPGVNRTQAMLAVLEMSTDKTKSYIALRDAERIMTEISDVRLTAYIVRTELKSTLKSPELTKDTRMSTISIELRNILDKVEGYIEVCDKSYDYMTEMLFGVSQVNVSVNRRFYNGEDMMLAQNG